MKTTIEEDKPQQIIEQEKGAEEEESESIWSPNALPIEIAKYNSGATKPLFNRLIGGVAKRVRLSKTIQSVFEAENVKKKKKGIISTQIFVLSTTTKS